MAGVQEEHRRRIALFLLGLGAALVLIGLGLGLRSYRALHSTAASTTQSVDSERPAVRLERDQQARVIQQVLFMLLVLAGILGVSLYAFHLWSRRFRQALFRKSAPPTPSEDVWAMHQIPDEAAGEDHDRDREDNDISR